MGFKSLVIIASKNKLFFKPSHTACKNLQNLVEPNDCENKNSSKTAERKSAENFSARPYNSIFNL